MFRLKLHFNFFSVCLTVWVDLIKLKQYHLHNFTLCAICECLIHVPLEGKEVGGNENHSMEMETKRNIIIMVFKVSFVIIINLFSCSC